MSDIRRLNAIKVIEAIPHAVRSPSDMARAEHLRPRGSDLRVEMVGAVNIQHWDAHKVLQGARPGAPANCVWGSKKNNSMRGIYTRPHVRPNISRKWLEDLQDAGLLARTWGAAAGELKV